jgi:hypothetical protein
MPNAADDDLRRIQAPGRGVDSGLALRAPQNDSVCGGVTSSARQPLDGGAATGCGQ